MNFRIHLCDSIFDYKLQAMGIEELKSFLPQFTDEELLKEMSESSKILTAKPGDILMEPGKYVKMVPIVLSGYIKILRLDDEGKELFLYYLDPGETCALSLTCCAASKPSEIKAVVEEDTSFIGIPIEVHEMWTGKYKQWKNFVSTTYQSRFNELLTALDAVAFKRMDQRLMNYIVVRMKQGKTNELSITHQEIATELGTSREVISRLLKQLEKKKWIELGRNVIYIRDDFEELISK